MTYKQLSTGGLQVLEAILGYKKVLIVDSIETNSSDRGILELTPNDLSDSAILASPHDTNFPTALEIGKKSVPDLMPEIIKIIAIQIPIQTEISDQMSEETIKKIPVIKKMILNQIQQFLEE